ncbi:mandelate racemase/muconate lactonizing enzyme family protein [Aquimarina algicola]|uniref:Mandelate racemase/muconate lactonizing enzyme family protein n=1 Tax=Aquimarina algicola TaxID=2589995 RepID=A0A504J3D8_9FLAO|nr:mandelate racemase/muconate lactonizing enzyme family protein [Aquimarina algicola]TPN81200.1 mandelate racemase/muconate lactonizing enzyme family protein [Aquimarina algicola]
MKPEIKRRKFLSALGLGLAGTTTVIANQFNGGLGTKDCIHKVSDTIKITNIKTYVHPQALFVKIETDAGVIGWGEGDHDNPKIIAKIVREVCKPYLLHQDPFQSEYLWHTILYRGEDLGLSGALTGALAGIDNALWDLKGKLLDFPVYKLLGGAKVEKIKVYGSFGVKNGKKSISEAQNMAANFIDTGYDTVKLRMQIRVLKRNPEDDITEKYVKAVREVIGDENTLFVDFNNGYTPGKAIDLIKKLYEKYNIQLVEEPVHYLDYEGLKQCVDQSPIRIGAGEHQFNRWDFKNLIVKGNADVLNLDLIKGGGLSEMKKIAALAMTFEKEIMCHNARPTLATAATLHFIASIFNPARVQEYGGTRPKLKLGKLFENNFKFENGHLYVPQNPGLGLKVNEKEMSKYLDT